MTPNEFALALNKSLTYDHQLDYQPPPNSKPFITIPGIPRPIFTKVVEAVCTLHAFNHGDLPSNLAESLKDMTGVPISTVKKILGNKIFFDAMVLRGVYSADAGTLSGEQLRALAVLSDVSSHLALETKLKRAGITWYKWQAWMNDKSFRAAHDKISHDIFKNAQSSIDSQVASGALEGRLDFIKYYNELSGKHDPARRAHSDVQTILNGIVEILTRNITDPTILTRISSELSAVVSKLG